MYQYHNSRRGDMKMCLGIPLKIIEINNNEAVGELKGLRKKIRIDLIPNVHIDDYVMVHAGFAIEKITEKTAEDIGQAIAEVNEEAFKLKMEFDYGKYSEC